MAVKSDRASWSSLEPMRPAQQPRDSSSDEVPSLGGRIKDVLTSGYQHRSGWEIAVYFITLVILMTTSSLIWESASTTALKIVELIIAVAVIGAVSTAMMVKIRFRN